MDELFTQISLKNRSEVYETGNECLQPEQVQGCMWPKEEYNLRARSKIGTGLKGKRDVAVEWLRQKWRLFVLDTAMQVRFPSSGPMLYVFSTSLSAHFLPDKCEWKSPARKCTNCCKHLMNQIVLLTGEAKINELNHLKIACPFLIEK